MLALPMRYNHFRFGAVNRDRFQESFGLMAILSSQSYAKGDFA
jgi:hypothetical protein